MKVKVYKLRKNLPISPFVLDLSAEGLAWYKLNKLLMDRIYAFKI